MARVGRDRERTSSEAQKVVLVHHPQHALVIEVKTLTLQLGRDAPVSIGWPLHGDFLHLVTNLHLYRSDQPWYLPTVKSGPVQAGHLAQRVHGLAFRRGLLDFFKQAAAPLTTAGG